MRFHFLLCTSLALVCVAFTREINSKNYNTNSHQTRKEIEFYQKNIPKPRLPPKEAWKSICAPNLLYWRNSCYEAYKQGPCRRGSFISPSIKEAMPRCVKNPCKKNGWVRYNGICQALETQGSCAPNQVIGVNETTLKIECIRKLDSAKVIPRLKRRADLFSGSRRSLKRQVVYNIIAEVPMIRTTPFPVCPLGSFKSKSGECRKPIAAFLV